MSNPPKYLILYVDPGEDTGWCVGHGKVLVGAGTTKMWPFADDVAIALKEGTTRELQDNEAWVVTGRENLLDLPIGEIVCEDWRLYPHKLKALAWDQCRTARLIGGLKMLCRLHGIPFRLQPAAIKAEAMRLGAEEFYYHPLHPNRHQNDAIQHWVYYTEFGSDGSGYTPSSVSNQEQD